MRLFTSVLQTFVFDFFQIEHSVVQWLLIDSLTCWYACHFCTIIMELLRKMKNQASKMYLVNFKDISKFLLERKLFLIFILKIMISKQFYVIE